MAIYNWLYSHLAKFRLLRLLLLILLLKTGIVWSQQRTDPGTVSITISDKNIPEALRMLAVQEGLTIYFLEDWFGPQRLSRVYSSQTLESVLEDLLADTEVNFYRYSGEILVLTKSNRIYDALPPGFFGATDTALTAGSAESPVPAASPIFIADTFQPESPDTEQTVRIGRQGAEVAQRYILEGHIREQETGRPMADVAVLITNPASNQTMGTATDSEGYYRMNLPPGEYLLRTRFIGMTPVSRRLIIYGNGQLNLEVEEGVQVLEEVVVAADADRNVEEVTAGSDRIVSEETKDIPLVLGERNILEVAASLPGISRAGEGATGLNVRGGRADQNQFLLNGASVFNPTHFFGIFQALNPFVTESVDIYKGAIPVEFGGRLASVFDIHTIAGDTAAIKGEGSIGPVTANAALEIPVRKGHSSLVVGARAAYSDWILRSLGDDRLSGDQASFYDGVLVYTDRINSRNRLRATAYYSRDRFSLTRDSLVGYSNRALSAEWDWTIDERNQAAATVTNSRYTFDLGYDGSGNSDFEFDFAVEESELKLLNRFRLNEDHLLTYGLSGKYYRVYPGRIAPSGPDSDVQYADQAREQGLEAGLFLSDRFTIGDRLEVDAGLRWSFFGAIGPSEQRQYPDGGPRNPGTATDTLNFDGGEFFKTYGGPEIRASVRYLLGPELSIRAGYNNMYQYIHTLSNTTTVSPIDTWKLSDYNIRPQQNRLVSLGIFRNFNEAEYEVSLEGYYKWSKDVLDFKTGARILLNEQVETEVVQGDGRSWGVEFLLRKNSGRLNGWFGYTYSRSKIRFDSPYPTERINDGEFFPSNYDRPHDLSLVANYRFTRRYSLSVNFAYQTGRPITYPIGQFYFNNAEYVLYSDRNKYRIPDYIRLDLGVNIEGSHRKEKLAHSFWTISVYNVLGRNNPYSVYFVSDGGEVKALQSSIFAVPIPAITYNFKF